MKRMILALVAISLLFVGVGVGIGWLTAPKTVTPAKNLSGAPLTGNDIYPSIYITGSSGKVAKMEPMVAALTKDKSSHATDGLQIVVKENLELDVKGKIADGDRFPTIILGMEKGTNSLDKYEKAIQLVESYLASHYTVPYVNMLGYSTGATGILRFIIDYGQDAHYPPVKKFVSLDGVFNDVTPLAKGQSLDQLIQSGPVAKTDMYKFWENNIKKVSPSTQVMLLAGGYKPDNQSDGFVPWADSFAVYNLLVKNDNPVLRYIYYGQYSDHTNCPKNAQMIELVDSFFYH